MILQKLCELYERLEKEDKVPSPGFVTQGISFEIVLTPEGELVQINDLRDPNGKKMSPVKRRVPMTGTGSHDNSGKDAFVLYDNGQFLLGRIDDKKLEEALEKGRRNGRTTEQSKQDYRERLTGCLTSARAVHQQAAKECLDVGIQAIASFLNRWSIEQVESLPEKDRNTVKDAGSGWGVFRLQGEMQFVHERPAILAWWAGKIAKVSDSPLGHCLVTGGIKPIARIHMDVKGVLGAQGTGAAIVSFNKEAFTSFGKSKGGNAPISESSAFQYCTALNWLLAKNSGHSVVVGDATCVFWAEKPDVIEDMLSFLFSIDVPSQDEAQLKKIESFLKQAASGILSSVPDGGTSFYILGLTGQAKARLGVRFWMSGTVAEFSKRLAEHVGRLEIIRGEKDRRFLAISNLLDQTVRFDADTKKYDRDKIMPLLAGELTRSILMGCQYPESMLASVLRRIKADRMVSHPRAAYIKAHLSHPLFIPKLEKEITVALNENRLEPAYHCGRLFAVLEKIQREALGDINSGIKDRYFGSAMATPAAVFPRLIKLSGHHLAKYDKPAFKTNDDKLFQSVMGKIDSFPAHMSLSDQGLFAIGYYHQRADFFKKKEVSPDA